VMRVVDDKKIIVSFFLSDMLMSPKKVFEILAYVLEVQLFLRSLITKEPKTSNNREEGSGIKVICSYSA